MKILKRIIGRFKKHNFIRMTDACIEVDAEKGYNIPRYQCQVCGSILHLDSWQMEELPASMKYYCNTPLSEEE